MHFIPLGRIDSAIPCRAYTRLGEGEEEMRRYMEGVVGRMTPNSGGASFIIAFAGRRHGEMTAGLYPHYMDGGGWPECRSVGYWFFQREHYMAQERRMDDAALEVIEIERRHRIGTPSLEFYLDNPPAGRESQRMDELSGD